MSTPIAFIENELDLSVTERYAAILGETPSQGAKSPTLWNAAFEGLSLSGVMHPMDVTGENLEALVDALRRDERFVGGAVTMPYKVDILPYLDAIEPEAEAIGAINCLFRDGDKLIGTNTDGAGALWSLENAMGESLAGKTVVQIGTGGAGLAVAAYLAAGLGREGTLILGNRSAESALSIGDKLRNTCVVEVEGLPVSDKQLSRADVIVNCTSLGFDPLVQGEAGVRSMRFYSPLATVGHIQDVEEGADAIKQFAMRNADTIGENFGQTVAALAAADQPLVFDIVYQPETTMLLAAARQLGYKTLSGLPMNLEQAVIAFDKATVSAGLRASDQERVRELMRNVA